MKTIKAEAKAIWHLAPLPVHADELDVYKRQE